VTADKTTAEMPDWVSPTRSDALSASAKPRRRHPAATRPASTTPEPKAQKNCPDPQSWIMKSKGGFGQPCNAQIVVYSAAQIIAAQDVTQSAVDSG
jgi:hypothetical protein